MTLSISNLYAYEGKVSDEKPKDKNFKRKIEKGRLKCKFTSVYLESLPWLLLRSSYLFLSSGLFIFSGALSLLFYVW